MIRQPGVFTLLGMWSSTKHRHGGHPSTHLNLYQKISSQGLKTQEIKVKMIKRHRHPKKVTPQVPPRQRVHGIPEYIKKLKESLHFRLKKLKLRPQLPRRSSRQRQPNPRYANAAVIEGTVEPSTYEEAAKSENYVKGLLLIPIFYIDRLFHYSILIDEKVVLGISSLLYLLASR